MIGDNPEVEIEIRNAIVKDLANKFLTKSLKYYFNSISEKEYNLIRDDITRIMEHCLGIKYENSWGRGKITISEETSKKIKELFDTYIREIYHNFLTEQIKKVEETVKNDYEVQYKNKIYEFECKLEKWLMIKLIKNFINLKICLNKNKRY